MLKILIFSRTPWRSDNSFGNTYSNWFSKMENVEIAHICLADGTPYKEMNVTQYYQVSEKALTKSIFKRHNKVGEIITSTTSHSLNVENKDTSFFGKIVSYCKQHRLSLFFMLRELIWKLGKINYDQMKSFIYDFNPDIVFMPMYYAGYVDRVVLRALKDTHIPIILEAAVDVYSLRQISYDPFYWINRFYVRGKTKKIIEKTKLLYVISEKQRKDYSNYFDIPVKVMYKFPDRNRMKYDYKNVNQPIKYLYTGNLGLGRWKTLSTLAKALKEIGGGTLDIYSATELTDTQKSSLNIEGVSVLHPPITQQQVIDVQNKADVLVHVESFNKKNKLSVRYSISTKIMDYISTGRCILAIGPSDVASLEYLSTNKLAVLANNDKEVFLIIKQLKENNKIIEEIANNNYIFIHKSLDEGNQRLNFKNDLQEIANCQPTV